MDVGGSITWNGIQSVGTNLVANSYICTVIAREAEKKLRQLARQFRSVAVVGPRQSGKTTLVQKTFPRKAYISLEDPDERLLASNDPRAFLNRFKNGAIHLGPHSAIIRS